MRVRYGWKACGIIGMTFIPMGLLFLVLGFVLGPNPSVEFDSPEERKIFLAIFCGIGGIFLLAGLILLFIDLRRRYLLRRAYEGGNKVDAVFTGMVFQRSVNTVYGAPRMAECAWTDPNGVVHIYRSRYLYTDVSKLLTSDTVPVYVDRYNEDIGFVDIDAALPEIRIHR